jgi:hypothetical protein
MRVAWDRGPPERLRAASQDTEPLGEAAPANRDHGQSGESRPESDHRSVPHAFHCKGNRTDALWDPTSTSRG